MKAHKTLRVALVGCGTVGGATAEILLRERDLLIERSGVDVELVAIVSLTFNHARELGLPEELFTEDIDTVLAEHSLDIVIELAGGIEFPRELIKKALDAGAHVVTANKALLAHHGKELFAYARERGLTIGFEASCGGGIPIIRAITDGLVANHIDALYGIVNGTCNYILTEMIEKGQSYSEALADAQGSGLAEADPSLDVEGGDSAHKLAIMTSLAFGTDVEFDAIPVTGINNLQATDVAFGLELGYVVKLLAVAYRLNGGVTAWVRPAFISKEHPLAWVAGPFNAVSVYGHRTGHTLYYGRGAGGDPTASAVVADILAIGTGTLPATFQHTGYWPDRNAGPPQISADQASSRYYLRIMAQDRPGVLASVASILGANGISIASLIQNEKALRNELIPVVITTHVCQEASLRKALTAIDALPQSGERTVFIPIVDEHPERWAR
ncbi:MAG: homoserine dehydrogenase [Spirochaeta sp.]|jgi:homoserine dehydrogenase|nr:homoserine dehydrogenase [Spirochaeta sp.]